METMLAEEMLVEEMFAEEILDCYLEQGKTSTEYLTRQMQIVLDQENYWDHTATGRDILEQLGMNKAETNLWNYLAENNIKTVQQIDLGLQDLLYTLNRNRDEEEDEDFDDEDDDGIDEAAVFEPPAVLTPEPRQHPKSEAEQGRGRRLKPEYEGADPDVLKGVIAVFGEDFVYEPALAAPAPQPPKQQNPAPAPATQEKSEADQIADIWADF